MDVGVERNKSTGWIPDSKFCPQPTLEGSQSHRFLAEGSSRGEDLKFKKQTKNRSFVLNILILSGLLCIQVQMMNRQDLRNVHTGDKKSGHCKYIDGS